MTSRLRSSKDIHISQAQHFAWSLYDSRALLLPPKQQRAPACCAVPLTLATMSGAVVKKLPEPLLDPNPDRFCMFPIKYHTIWEFYKKAEASFWTGARCARLDRPLAAPRCPHAACLQHSRDLNFSIFTFTTYFPLV